MQLQACNFSTGCACKGHTRPAAAGVRRPPVSGLSLAASLQRAERRRDIAGRNDMRIWCAFERIACGVRRNLRAITRVGVLWRTNCLNCRSSVEDQLFLRGRLFVAMCTSFDHNGL
jgi:hypothetical protein